MDIVSPRTLATADAHQPLARRVVLTLFVVFLAIPFLIALFSDRPFAEVIDWLWVGMTAALALIIIPVVWRAFAPPAHSRKAFQHAPLALGTLVSARSTGRSINDQPELELTFDVERVDSDVLRGTTKAVIDVGALPQFVPGVLVPMYRLPDGQIGVAFDATEEQVQNALHEARVDHGITGVASPAVGSER